jgi:hypothetical protein
MTQQTYELFDKYGHYCFYPDAATVEAMEPEMRERLRAVQEASKTLDAATANRKAAEQAITDALAERDGAEAALKIVRPSKTHTELAKEFIASERAQR